MNNDLAAKSEIPGNYVQFYHDFTFRIVCHSLEWAKVRSDALGHDFEKGLPSLVNHPDTGDLLHVRKVIDTEVAGEELYHITCDDLEWLGIPMRNRGPGYPVDFPVFVKHEASGVHIRIELIL